MEGNPFIFPDEDDVDLINNTFNGPEAQILIPNELLHQALDATGDFIDCNGTFYISLNG